MSGRFDDKDINKWFGRYIREYIRHLTGSNKEYFIAIVDIERELAEEFIYGNKERYEAAWFERRDYARAVALRNDRAVSRIVLFSNDSVKMIDSLKDFVEYPAIPEEKEVLWQCLETAFSKKLDDGIRKVLETVLESQQISVKDLLSYLGSCIDEDGLFSAIEAVRNLYQLNIWTSEATDIKKITKTKLRKMIRNSDAQIVERKMMSGIAENKIPFSAKTKGKIIRCLSQNDLQEVFRIVSYETVEDILRGATRIKKTDSAQEKTEEQKYDYSYQYALQEHPEESMEEVEDFLLQEENELLLDSAQKFQYPETEKLEAAFQELQTEMGLLALSEEKREALTLELDTLQHSFFASLERGKKYTPAYLCHYADTQKEFVGHYVRILGKCVSDAGIAHMCVGTKFLEKLQNLFCNYKDGKYVMPFYHPLAGLYYICRQRSCEEKRELLSARKSEFREEAVNAWMEKERMEFPIQYMLADNELYQLDYTCLSNWQADFRFTNVKGHTAGSFINVRLLNEDLLDYIERQKFMPEVRVTIVDINDMSEIMSVIKKLRKLAESDAYMLHKVILNIISDREEELKRQLQERMETDLDHPQMLFRFAREAYVQDGEYDMERIIKDSDLLFLADSSVLYQKPRLQAWRDGANWLQIRFENLGLEELLDHGLQGENHTLEILWDTMHHMQLEEEVKLSYWHTRELKQTLLAQIRRAVKERCRLTAVILSSNPDLLQHLFHLQDFQVRKSMLSGKEMLIVNFHRESIQKPLNEEGEAAVTVALKPFLEEILGISELKSIQSETGDLKEEPFLTIRVAEERLVFQCEVYVEDPGEDDGERSEHYQALVEDILAFTGNHMFRKKFVTMLYESAENYPSALMLDYLKRSEISMGQWEYSEKLLSELEMSPKRQQPLGVVEVLAFQSAMDFLRRYKRVDEYMANRFLSLYRPEMLVKMLNANRQLQFLDNGTLDKIQKLYTKVEERNE